VIKTDRKTDCVILDRLEKRYSRPHWVFLRELRNDTGFQSTRACDALAVGMYHSRGQLLIGFEKKVSRSDWLRELKEPAKAEAIAQFCDYWNVVIPDPSIVNLDELPPTWGLLYVKGSVIKILKDAPTLSPRPLDRGMLAAIIERSIEQAIKPYLITKEEAKQQELDAAFERGRLNAAREIEMAEVLRSQVDAFEQASGLKISNYHGGRELGEQVAAIRRNARFIRDAESQVKSAAYELRNRTLPAMEEFLSSINAAAAEPEGHTNG
jgi:hypothetical protein